jgi:hypothetical protein
VAERGDMAAGDARDGAGAGEAEPGRSGVELRAEG